MRIVSYALVVLMSLGFAYAVGTIASSSIADSLNQSAIMIDEASHAR